MTDKERRPRRRDGAPVQEVSNNSVVGDTSGAWWSKPPNQIRAEELDAVARRTVRAVGVLEVAAAMTAELAT